MRRAVKWLGVTLCAVALLPAGSTTAAVKPVNGIGLIDYSRKPDFKVGDWVRYHMTGAKDDYMVTVLIAGEEDFWGDEAFWVETWTEPKDAPPMGTATLMSYAIFRDSLPLPRMQLYQRKSVNEADEHGNPIQVVMRRSSGSLKVRTPFDDQVAVDFDTLGQDTVSVPRGTYSCLKVEIRQGKSTTRDFTDSTEYIEVWDKRRGYYNREIPITSLAREEIESSYQQRKWRVGRSEEAPPLRYLDRSLGEARLVDFGRNLKSRVLPEYMMKPLPRKAAGGAAPKPPPKAGAAKKSG
jgi:hypothetical protein